MGAAVICSDWNHYKSDEIDGDMCKNLDMSIVIDQGNQLLCPPVPPSGYVRVVARYGAQVRVYHYCRCSTGGD